MYSVFKNVLSEGGYDLKTMLHKIKTVWVQGNDLTDEQYEELTRLARSGADIQQSVDFLAKLEELDKRVKALERENTTAEEFPAFAAEKWYYNGDKCSFSGVNYVCIAPEGTVCVWSPDEYPAYWKDVNLI